MRPEDVTPGGVAAEGCELHPIVGHVLCACKEITLFEGVYKDVLEIAVRVMRQRFMLDSTIEWGSSSHR